MDTPTPIPQPVPMQSPGIPPGVPPSNMRWSLVLGILAIVLLVGGVGAYVSGIVPFGSAPETTPEPSASVTQLPAGVKTFKSETLGVSFEYLTAQGEPIVEQGNTVYVGGTDGQWVEIFAKKTDESLEQSIRRQVLASYPSNLCKIEVSPSNIQSGYQVAEISYPQASDGPEPWFENSKLCNPDYAQTNGIRYFLFNPVYPERFFFFSIGQYAILAEPAEGGGGKTWQDTFRVMDVGASDPIVYMNSEHGFMLNFPQTWAGYTVEKLNPPLQGMTATYAIRPREKKTPQEELPVVTIDVFTEAQWKAEQALDRPHPTELGMGRVSPAYVYATPFRFEYSGLPYESDIEDILKSFGVISM